MTVSVPAELEAALVAQATKRKLSPEEIVREALVWYLQIEPELMDELDAWQEVRDEALRLTEDSPA